MCRTDPFPRLSKNDGLFQWTKTKTQSPLFTAHQWKRLPAEITVRIIRFTFDIRGFRSRRITLVTSLLDGQLYPAHELAHLYKRRWRLELCLRDLKTTLGMDQLRCQSPEMAQKELLAGTIQFENISTVWRAWVYAKESNSSASTGGQPNGA